MARFSKSSKRYTIVGINKLNKLYKYKKKCRTLVTAFRKMQELKRKGLKDLIIYDEHNIIVYNEGAGVSK